MTHGDAQRQYLADRFRRDDVMLRVVVSLRRARVVLLLRRLGRRRANEVEVDVVFVVFEVVIETMRRSSTAGTCWNRKKRKKKLYG
jgi:hypothetical protein